MRWASTLGEARNGIRIGGVWSKRGCSTVALTGALLAFLLFAWATPSAVAAVPFGNVLELDGVDDYASITDNSTLDLGDTDGEDFTIESFFSVPNETNETLDTILYKQNAYGLFINFNTSSMDAVFFRFWHGPGTSDFTTLFSSTNLSAGTHHIAAVFDNEFTASNDRVAIYLDGSQFADNSAATDLTPGVFNSTAPLTLGAGNGLNHLEGWQEEARLSDVVRYSAAYVPPSSPFTSDASTRALWHFDEPACSTSFADSSGNANTLTGLNGAQTGDPATTLCASTTTLDTVKTSTDIEATGTVTPSHTGLKVVVALFQKSGGPFVKLDTNRPTLDGASSYATSFPRPADGRCKVRATFRGDSDHAASSAIDRFAC
jgi:concanavalin A-like lectin/glucanase superfamily protein